MNGHRRSLRIIGLAVMAAAALSAFTAGSAFAAHTGHQWTVGEEKLANNATKAVVPSLMSANAVLTGTVQNQAFEMTATGLECGSTCVIEQKIEGENARALAKGKLKFTGLSVVKPAGCSAATTLTSEELTAELVTNGGTLYAKFAPAGTTFAKITLTGCAAAETYSVKGSVCAVTDPIGTMTVAQPATFAVATNGSCAEGAGLTLGGKAANIVGEATNTLSGGASWGAATF